MPFRVLHSRHGLAQLLVNPGGGRCRAVREARYAVSYLGVHDLGRPAIQVARALGVSLQAVLRGVERGPGRDAGETARWNIMEVPEVRPLRRPGEHNGTIGATSPFPQARRQRERDCIAYNAFGQPVSTTDALGNTTMFTGGS